MDTAIVSALSAVLGSIVGGSATITATWLTQKTKNKQELVGAEIQKRELLYAEFIVECSKLFVDAIDHTLDHPDKLYQVYSLQNRIRLTSSEAVVISADQTMENIIKQYFEPNIKPEDFRNRLLSTIDNPTKWHDSLDPLKPFSEVCRKELNDLKQTAVT